LKYKIPILLLSCLLSVFFFSCREQKTDWKPQYDAKSTAPHGFSLFSFGLQKAFPKKLHLSTINTSVFKEVTVSDVAYIVVANAVEFSELELTQLNEWLYYGNDVVIITEQFGPQLSKYLKIGSQDFFNIVTANVDNNALMDTAGLNSKLQVFEKFNPQPKSYNFNSFKEPLLAQAFNMSDKTIDKDSMYSGIFILSALDSSKINAFAADVGAGRLIVACNPLLLSNYALLQANNKDYLAHLLSYLKPNIKDVYVAVGHTRSAEHANLGVLWRHKGTRAAMLIALIGLLLYVLNNMRRKQNVIPIIKPLNNDSKSFIETIANLYVEKRNHKNVAHKIVQHFLEYIRSQYHLNTNVMDAAFRKKLASRSGISEAETGKVIVMVNHVIEDTIVIDDNFLTQLYTSIQKFYKQQL
jgi:hypothetical protein